MAANYYYGFGHGGGQFSLSSGSYQSRYSTPSSNSRTQQQAYTEPHSQLQYGAFSNQLESSGSASYGDNKSYYMSPPQSTSATSYTSSTGDDNRYSLESNYNQTTRYLPGQTASINSDHSSYLTSIASKSPYASTTYSKPSEWHNVATSGPQSSQSFSISDRMSLTQSSTETGFDSSLFKAASHYRDLTSGNQSSGSAAAGNRKPFLFGQRPKPRQPPKPSQLHYCEVCRISCAGAQTYMEHLEGKNHKKKEAQAKAAETLTAKTSSNPSVRQLYCQLCDVACTGVDTYAAHMRGSKHQKVLNLHTKLGKPIPEVPAADAVVAGGGKTSSVVVTSSGVKKVIVPVKLNFVGGSQLSTTGTNEEGNLDEKADKTLNSSKDEPDGVEEDNDIQPVGLEYIEESRNEMGSAVSFHCKLCDCNFTDPLAKVMHTKGRRHRLHYKQKVDPTLHVSMKPSPYQKHRQMNRQMMKARRHMTGDDYWRRRYYDDPYRQEVEELRFEKEFLQWQLSHALERYDMLPSAYPMPPLPSLHLPVQRQAPETDDDRHVKAKHASVYPNEEDLSAVQLAVTDCEKALKMVSDTFANETDGENRENLTETSPETKDEPKDESIEPSPSAKTSTTNRELKGLMRVGALSKGLLLHGDLNLELIVLCHSWPTHDLLSRVMDEFVKRLKELAPDKYNVSLSHDKVCIIVDSLSQPVTKCVISLTSLAVKNGSDTEQTRELLDRSKCLESLASLRHAKWFQAKASSLFSCVILVRILKDLCERIPTWKPLSHWALELLTEKCLSSYGEPLHPGAGLQRILESISSGIFLNGGPGLHDPCEKESTDVLSSLTLQEREDITISAQHALRLITFGQIHKVLGMDALPSTRFPAYRRKRQRADCQGQQGDSMGGLPQN